MPHRLALFGVIGVVVFAAGKHDAAAQRCIKRPADAPPPSDEDIAESARLNAEADAAYKAGDLAKANVLLTAALAKNGDVPILLYNLGKTLEKSGDVAGAIECLEVYLQLENTALEDRKTIFAHVQELKAKLAGPSPTPSDPAGKAGQLGQIGRATPKAGRPSKLPWVVIGAGAAGLAAGGTMSYLVTTNRETAGDLSVPQREAKAAHDRAERYATWQYVGYGVGALAVAGGITWMLIDRRRVHDEDQHVQLQIGPGSVALGGVF